MALHTEINFETALSIVDLRANAFKFRESIETQNGRVLRT